MMSAFDHLIPIAVDSIDSGCPFQSRGKDIEESTRDQNDEDVE